MGILDDAIKEHLELKRQHGAGESELQQLEDEAFGAAERPGGEASADSLAEAPTQFMSQPDSGEQELEGAEALQADDEAGRRRISPDIADLQEPPQVAPEPAPEPEEPAEEAAPAMEHEAIPEPEPPAGPSTEERHAIAEQPTEMYDVEEELTGDAAQAPSEEELVEEEFSEPRLAPVDPVSGVEEAEEDDDFFDEQRLSDELDQALEAPAAADDELEPDDEPPPPGQEEDVLEETPDFLEEAPEDDQLWFEQKPPKDFDFDD
ncbi:MAG TPA: hypothetical protein VHQ43_09645 [Solirubrobacterales bacterium]|jgi:hypothetical protein|nr:hypothetical protein [Solirubrobacterales bacterium]